MHPQTLPKRHRFKLTALAVLAAALAGDTHVRNATALAVSRVNLAVSLSPPRLVNSPANLIECVDTTRNLGPDTSNPTWVKFYLGTNTNRPTQNPSLLAHGTGFKHRNVSGFTVGMSSVRSNSAALFMIPTPRPTGRQYIIAEILAPAGNQDINYANNVAIVPIDF